MFTLVLMAVCVYPSLDSTINTTLLTLLSDQVLALHRHHCFRYEEELDRVNDILTESESRRRALQKEVDTLSEEVGHTKCC